jgi:hypothetical protein
MTETQIVWDTFLVRIWHETPGRAWRGEITHLPTQAAVHFATLEQAVAFMQRFVPELASSAPAVERKAQEAHGNPP